MDDIRARLEKALAGGYTFERELGGGGMSRTYLAVETALQRRVVVKVLAPELLAGISVERFRREVLLAAKLQHPHVVPVLSTGEIDGIPWFTMPYVEGDSLRDRLAKGPLSIGEAVSTLRDVARALVYAHRHGIVHRDIKPDNVLLSAGTATVTDFGIAKAISAARTDGGQAHETLTQIGTSIGTPTYMAPEQAAGDPDTDHRADLYAFGAMGYELLAGRPPFVAATPTRLLAAHMSEPPRDLLELRADCPPALAALLMSCLAKDPGERPQEAAAVVRVLDGVTTSGSAEAMPQILRGGSIPLGRALALWAIATLLVGLVAWAAREAIGLPDWVLPGSIGVMLAGLPVLAFTAYAQRLARRTLSATPSRTPMPNGTLATMAIRASPHLSWRRAWLGGALAVGTFTALVISFMVMRAMGIGPMASLQGKGEFGSSERLMVADFRSPPEDSTLGRTVAEALRTDLAQSSSLNVLTRSAIRDALTLMQRPPDQSVPYDLAREIATREGAKAVLDGSISRLGQSYVITARLVSAMDGNDLATFRQEAASEDALLTALGKLSKQVRTRAGESLKSVRASSELERVTTPSLAALRKYVEGSRLADEMGEGERGIALLREAVAIDTSFAMAWRKIAVLLNNEQRDRDQMIEAVSTAYRHRDRLTEMERLLTEGFYYTRGPEPDRRKALAAYEEAAAIDTLSTAALNNAAVILGEIGEYEKAEDLYRRVTNLSNTFGGAFTNLLIEQIRNGRPGASLDSTVARYREVLGESHDFWEAEWFAAWGKGDIATADSIANVVAANPKTARQAIRANAGLGTTAELRGRLADAGVHYSRSRTAEYQLGETPGSLLNFAIDSAYLEAAYGTKAAALAALERGLARVDIESIPPTERPWDAIKYLGARLHEPKLVREATAGWERDQAAMSNDVVGRRADFAVALAYAEHRWADVVAQSRIAEERFAMDPRVASVVRGVAFQEMGQADSAIVALENFLDIPDASGDSDATNRADVLQRLGELYEAKGDRTRAIDFYSRFTAQWADADPLLQPKVREIRERIERLRGETG